MRQFKSFFKRSTKNTINRTLNVGNGNQNNNYISNVIHTTKYSLLSFLPKNLFQQFHRWANVYFLFVVILNWIPDVNAFGKEVAMLPLLGVLSVTALKDVYEDFKRFRSDKETNNRSCIVYNRNSRKFHLSNWKYLVVGSIIKICENEIIPADLIIAKSSDSQGVCFIDTATLDGETNLKQKYVVDILENNANWPNVNLVVTCDEPNPDLHSFNGYINSIDSVDVNIKLTKENILLRGSVLKNVKCVEGFIIYTGHETKTILNCREPRFKRSLLENQINWDVLWCCLILFILCLGCSFGSGFWLASYNNTNVVPFIAYTDQRTPAKQGLLIFWTYIILFQVMIPLSLYVTFELVKIIQVYFIQADEEMMDKMGSSSICRALNITEDLGQIDIIFTDKTGTLTENKMRFKRFCICGIDYEHENEKQLSNRASVLPLNSNCEISLQSSVQPMKHIFQIAKNDNSNINDTSHFFFLLAICNSVYVTHERNIENEESENKKFEAESTDELALVEAASHYDYKLFDRTSNYITLSVYGEIHKFEILHTLKFDSYRKKMSVIIRHPITKNIILYCKGADCAILNNLSSKNDQVVVNKIKEQLLMYSKCYGYRILCMSYKILDESNYNVWVRKVNSAEDNIDIQTREKMLFDLTCDIEKDLSLLGVTGIEDSLQIGTIETMESLYIAGIKIWMLTGDKIETAINVAKSCKLINANDYIVEIISDNLESVINSLKTNFEKDNIILVFDNRSYGFLLHPDALGLFLKFVNKCHSILCCRLNADQKAAIVSLIKKQKKRCLAIGDGSNDVSMIRTASVGIGVYGTNNDRNSSAIMACDFVIPRFSYLKRLLFVHGHWSYHRLATLALYMWYKNAVFIFLLFWFQLFCGFSAITFLDDLNLMFYQLLYTSLPPIILGIFDQDLTHDILLKNPKLYKQGPKCLVYKPIRSYWFNILDSLWQSAVQFFVPYFAYYGQDVGIWTFGVTCLASSMGCSLLHICIESRQINFFLILSVLLSAIVYLLINVSLSLVCISCIHPANPIGVTLNTFKTPIHWLCVLLAIIIALLPRITIKALKNTLDPTAVMNVAINRPSDKEETSSKFSYFNNLFDFEQVTHL